MDNTMRWRKSSYSGSQGGECVEVAEISTGTAIRDSKHPEAGYLEFSAETWSFFMSSVKSDRL